MSNFHCNEIRTCYKIHEALWSIPANTILYKRQELVLFLVLLGFVTLGKLICYFTSFYVLKFCLCCLLRWSRMHTLTCCSTHAQRPLQRDPGYTALTFTDTFHWKSKVAEGPEGLELNRIITEQTLIPIAWCRKWTGLYEICWIILPRALINLFTMVQLSLYTTVYVFLMFWKFSKQPFPTFYTRYYNSLISLHKMAPLSTELFNLNQSNQSQPSLWAVARGTAGF